MNVNNLYAHCQHGFRNKRSCTTQLIEVMEELTQMIDEGNPIDIVYLDFRKAFDSVRVQLYFGQFFDGRLFDGSSRHLVFKF